MKLRPDNVQFHINFTTPQAHFSENRPNAVITDSATTMEMGHKTMLRARLLVKST